MLELINASVDIRPLPDSLVSFYYGSRTEKVKFPIKIIYKQVWHLRG